MIDNTRIASLPTPQLRLQFTRPAAVRRQLTGHIDTGHQ